MYVQRITNLEVVVELVGRSPEGGKPVPHSPEGNTLGVAGIHTHPKFCVCVCVCVCVCERERGRERERERERERVLCVQCVDMHKLPVLTLVTKCQSTRVHTCTV